MILRIDDVITSKSPKGGPGGPAAECRAAWVKNKFFPVNFKNTVFEQNPNSFL